ncbi:hypothetical protein BH23ACT9_BH23ACT9_36070 [soil metagenome]
MSSSARSASDDRSIPAPQLRETADIWWDSGWDPIIRWDASGRRYWLLDGAPAASAGNRLVLLVTPGDPPAEPRRIAVALRDGLAACDFPPNDPGVPEHRAAATLRAAGIPL